MCSVFEDICILGVLCNFIGFFFKYFVLFCLYFEGMVGFFSELVIGCYVIIDWVIYRV